MTSVVIHVIPWRSVGIANRVLAKLASPFISSIDAAVALAPQDVVTTLMMGNGVT